MKQWGEKKKVVIMVLVLVGIFLLLVTLLWIRQVKNDKELIGIPQASLFSGKDIYVWVHLSNYLPLWSGIQFSTGDSLQQIGEEIVKRNPETTIELREESLFISNADQTTGDLDYYYVYGKEDIGYSLGNFKAMYDDHKGYRVTFMIPMHLLHFTDESRPLYDIGYGYGESFEMVSDATIKDVYDFYQESGYYEVELAEGEVILKQTLYENQIISGTTINYQMNRPIVIKVTTENDKNYFTCTVEGKEDIR